MASQRSPAQPELPRPVDGCDVNCRAVLTSFGSAEPGQEAGDDRVPSFPGVLSGLA